MAGDARPPATGAAHRSTVPDVFASDAYTVVPSNANANGPYTSRSGSILMTAPPHGLVMRGRPSIVAMHAISPRGVHAGNAMRAGIRRACASVPSAEIVHISCPSRPLTMPAMNRPARDQVS